MILYIVIISVSMLWISAKLQIIQLILACNIGKMNRNVESLLEKPKQRYKSFVMMVSVCMSIALSNFYFGYSMVYLATIQTQVIKEIYNIPLDDDKIEGFLNGCIPLGALIGSFGSSILIARFSRRNGLLIFNAIAITMGILAYIPSFYLFFFVRIGQGICVGFCCTLAPLFNKEFSPIQISGTLGTFAPIFTTLGVCFTFGLKYIFFHFTGDPSGSTYWKYIFGFSFISLIVQSLLILFVFPYQTPKYLLLIGKEEEARKLLAIIYKQQYVEDVLKEKIDDLETVETRKDYVPLDTILSRSVGSESEKSRINLIVAFHLSILQQFSGINVFTVYLRQITRQVAPNLQDLMPFLIKIFQTMITVLSSYVLSKIGRKIILQVGTFFTGIASLITMAGYLIKNDRPKEGEILVFSGLFMFVAIFGFSLGPIVWLYIPQIVQPNIVPFATAINWIGAIIVITFFPIITETFLNGDPAFLFLFFAIWCFGSFFFDAKFVVQTKDKTQKQIREDFKALKLC